MIADAYVNSEQSKYKCMSTWYTDLCGEYLENTSLFLSPLTDSSFIKIETDMSNNYSASKMIGFYVEIKPILI